MYNYKIINQIKKLYQNGDNIIEFLRSLRPEGKVSVEDILISYDFQAGEYVQDYKNYPDVMNRYSHAIAQRLKGLGSFDSMVEVGVGEATTLSSVSKYIGASVVCLGFDVSWSRISVGMSHLTAANCKAQLCTGDLFCAPLSDCSVDVVYTVHCIEPNGGREKEALQELYRIARKYVVLFEPTYEFAAEDGKARMTRHGYIKGLEKTIVELGYKLICYERFMEGLNPLNPTGIFIIEKDDSVQPAVVPKFVCPISKMELVSYSSSLFCEKSLLSYPLIGGVPCLRPENAILTTKFSN